MSTVTGPRLDPAGWQAGPWPGALRWPGLEALGVDAVLTTRHGGVSEGPYASLNLALHVGDDPSKVVENRRRALGALGASLDDLIVGEQVHGPRCQVVAASDRGRGAVAPSSAVAGIDALVTAECGVVLMTLVADCTPVLLVDPCAKVVAVVHAGWRGTAARVVEAALQAMSGLGSSATDVVAVVGPAVAPSSYQVDAPVARALETCFGGPHPCLRPDTPGHWRLDLVAANRAVLAEAGVPESQILSSTLTTDDARLFSHRRTGGRPCGRFALLARLRP